MLDDMIDAAAARAAAQAGAQLVQVGWLAGGDYFHVAVFGVAHPAAQLQLAGLTVNEPAKAYALHTSLYQKMKNHSSPDHGQFCRCACRRATSSAGWMWLRGRRAVNWNHDGFRPRQLRFVYLQPGPIPGRTGRGGRGAPQRRAYGGRG